MSSYHVVNLLSSSFLFVTLLTSIYEITYVPRGFRTDDSVMIYFQLTSTLYHCFLGGNFLSRIVAVQRPSRRLKRMRLSPHPINGKEHGSQPSLATRDRELVFVLEVIIEQRDLNPRPLTL